MKRAAGGTLPRRPGAADLLAAYGGPLPWVFEYSSTAVA